MTTVDALVALSRSDRAAARRAAESARDHDPDSRLAAALVAYLGRARPSGVYDEPTAFEAFIDGGSNRALYAATMVHLTEIGDRVRPAAVLDIGCGDGRVTAAVLGPWTRRLDLVDPSAALLEAAEDRLAHRQVNVVAHATGISEMLARPGAGGRWDLVSSTFALHTLAPDERLAVLGRLVARAERLVIVEFDVPPFADRSVEHARYVSERYERGIAEYADTPSVVDGFLMPVLVGQFDSERPRHTFEQPADEWVEQLEATGWQIVGRTDVADYWWAPVVGIEATPADRS